SVRRPRLPLARARARFAGKRLQLARRRDGALARPWRSKFSIVSRDFPCHTLKGGVPLRATPIQGEMMKKSLFRLAGALLLFGALTSGLVPGLTPLAQAACKSKSCVVGGLCRACPQGGAQPCRTQVCCGVTTIMFCANCRPTCVPPP